MLQRFQHKMARETAISASNDYITHLLWLNMIAHRALFASKKKTKTKLETENHILNYHSDTESRDNDDDHAV